MQTFNVTGMTCGHCERAVTEAIRSRDADAKIEVDLDAGVVKVDAHLDEAAIREAIEEEGYQIR
ncbi:cation transporter [Pseudomonas knackmussii]|uniref:Cation transporter n=1 Tax=Pseudomonas knackmussii TaxID=65741 RepID=A0ABY4KMM0_9PSED|nr:cation transporter [Pseudomonas knackmussii]UPQ82098.1 cation transporter [Pseudomonas knackmussii]